MLPKKTEQDVPGFDEKQSSVRHHNPVGLDLIELASQFNQLNEKLEILANGRLEDEHLADQIIETQSIIIRQVLKTKSKNIEEVLAKLSIWHQDAPDIDSVRIMSRYDAMVESAFQDLKVLSEDKTSVKLSSR